LFDDLLCPIQARRCSQVFNDVAEVLINVVLPYLSPGFPCGMNKKYGYNEIYADSGSQK
jgi:hypothetical protein